jgi:hypothetical protein
VLTGPFSPLFGPFFRAKRAGPARLGPLRAGLGQKLKPAGSAGPARFWPGFTGPGPGRAGPARLAISTPVPGREQLATCEHLHICVQLASSVMCTHALQADYEHRAASDLQVAATRRLQTVMLHVRSIISFSAELIVRD